MTKTFIAVIASGIFTFLYMKHRNDDEAQLWAALLVMQLLFTIKDLGVYLIEVAKGT